jgi:hypothetical protein
LILENSRCFFSPKLTQIYLEIGHLQFKNKCKIVATYMRLNLAMKRIVLPTVLSHFLVTFVMYNCNTLFSIIEDFSATYHCAAGQNMLIIKN